MILAGIDLALELGELGLEGGHPGLQIGGHEVVVLLRPREFGGGLRVSALGVAGDQPGTLGFALRSGDALIDLVDGRADAALLVLLQLELAANGGNEAVDLAPRHLDRAVERLVVGFLLRLLADQRLQLVDPRRKVVDFELGRLEATQHLLALEEAGLQLGQLVGRLRHRAAVVVRGRRLGRVFRVLFRRHRRQLGAGIRRVELGRARAGLFRRTVFGRRTGRLAVAGLGILTGLLGRLLVRLFLRWLRWLTGVLLSRRL